MTYFPRSRRLRRASKVDLHPSIMYLHVESYGWLNHRCLLFDKTAILDEKTFDLQEHRKPSQTSLQSPLSVHLHHGLPAGPCHGAAIAYVCVDKPGRNAIICRWILFVYVRVCIRDCCKPDKEAGSPRKELSWSRVTFRCDCAPSKLASAQTRNIARVPEIRASTQSRSVECYVAQKTALQRSKVRGEGVEST
jgi:hypothetical protein